MGGTLYKFAWRRSNKLINALYSYVCVLSALIDKKQQKKLMFSFDELVFDRLQFLLTSIISFATIIVNNKEIFFLL